MKKKNRIAMMSLLLLLSFSAANACDICGCGVGSYYIGILPEFSKKIIGLRYRQNSLYTHIGAGGTRTYLTSFEVYRTAELWGGWTVGKRFRIMGSVPFIFNNKKSGGNKFTKSGLGDMAVQGFYKLLDGSKTVRSKLLVQSLWIGAGAKFSTGHYEALEKDIAGTTANIFQAGTGSTDLTVNAMYDVRLMDLGINLNSSYKINTVNRSGYRYGNKFSAALQGYYKFNIRRKFTIAPNTGILYESASEDSDHHYRLDVSGGHLLAGSIGLECNFSKVSVGANWQTPLQQDLANGFVKANDRGMIHFSLIL